MTFWEIDKQARDLHAAIDEWSLMGNLERGSRKQYYGHRKGTRASCRIHVSFRTLPESLAVMRAKWREDASLCDANRSKH